jgi:hypothetical protein
VAMEGTARGIVRKYLSSTITKSSKMKWTHEEAPGDPACKLRSLTVCQDNEPILGSALITSPVQICISIDVETPANELGLTLLVGDSEGKVIVHTSSMMNRRLRTPDRGQHFLKATLPAYLLNSGSYIVSVVSDIPNNRIIFYEKNVISFDVSLDSEELGRYSAGSWTGVTGPGIVDWAKWEGQDEFPTIP